MRIFKHTFRVSSAVAALIVFSPAYASEADVADASSDDPNGIGEIIVTAQKRSESVQRTPVAVTAFDTEMLEQQQISGVQQLQFNVPSLVFAQLTGYSQLSMRGIGSDLTVTAGEPTVATFQDGVYMGQLFGQAVPGFDLERIEVLRGPQGTLYGRNSTGGTINYITKEPEFVTGANLGATYGNYDRFAVEAGVTGALVPEKLAARFTVKYDRRDGYRFNLFDGKRYDANDQISGQGSLLFKPSDSFKFILRGDMSRQVSSPVQQFIAGLPGGAGISPETPTGALFYLPGTVVGSIPGVLAPGSAALLGNNTIAGFLGLAGPGQRGPDPTQTTDIQNDFPSRTRVDLRGVSGTGEIELGGATLKSITAYRFSRLKIQTDNDGSSAPILYEDPIIQTSKQFTQEFNLSGTGMDDRLDWLVGAFYLHDRASLKADLFLPSLGQLIVASGSLGTNGAPPFDLSRPLIPNLLQLISDPVLGTLIVTGQTTPIAFLGFGAEQTSSSIAGYGQFTYKLTDKLRFTGGLRYTRDEKEVFRRLHSNFVPAAALCETNSRRSWGAWTGTAGFDYDLADRTLAYAKVSRGYKAGGFNPAECQASFDPETLWSYEGGLKTTTANNQLRLNLAGFYYDFSDIQFTTYINNSSTIKNAANAKLYGLEAEMKFVPDGLKGFSIDGSGSWIHSRYGSQLLQDPTGAATLDIGGNRLIRAPEWKLNFGIQQQITTGSAGTFSLRGEGSYSSEVFHDVFNGEAPNQAETREAPYWIWNARLNWDAPGGRYGAQLFVENITDQLFAYSRVAAASGSYVSGQFSPPRTFGARVWVKLGGQ